MPDKPTLDDLPQASVVRTKRTRISIVWIIPLLAAVVAIGVAIQRIIIEGPTISIVFAAGDGIEAGKTLLKYKDVNIGLVTAVQLSDDFSKVKVTAKIARSADGLLVDDTKFWVVAPHIGLTGISGIGALLSGNYIGVQAGTSTHEQHHFAGLDVQPQVTDQKGRRFILHATDLGSLGIGAPIYYRNIPVGEVESVKLSADGNSVEIGAFIKAPYDRQVHGETRFWNASGIDLSIGENGLDVHTASLLALLAGGLSFDTPDFANVVDVAPDGTQFKVYRDRKGAMKQPEIFGRHFVLVLNESVRGLTVGASVTLMGLPVGEVTAVELSFDPKTLEVHPRVFFTFQPEQAAARFSHAEQPAVHATFEQDLQREIKLLRRMVEERGLRAHLHTASLLTGQRYVAFEFDAGAAKPRIDWGGDPIELPIIPGQIADIEARVSGILEKIDRMPIAAIGDRAATLLKTLNQTLKDVDSGALPALKQTLEGLDRVIDNANATLIGRDAPGQQALREALEELTNTAKSLRELTDYLEQHPEALIHGKRQEKK
jgi:paraquat-inducible protein B